MNSSRPCTPNIINDLKANEVFVFGSNATGFHGAGSAGLACRGESSNTWRTDTWFLSALNSPLGSLERVGYWAILGQARGYQEGTIGSSYAIETIKKPGIKRSTSLDEIEEQVQNLSIFAKQRPDKIFLVTKIGSSLAGYTILEIKGVFEKILDLPDNILLPMEYEFRGSIKGK